MKHNDDAFATMRLMSQIVADREELARPLSTAEWYQLRRKVREAGMSGMRDLLDLDMSGFMLRFGATEAEAYRYCILLNRALPMAMCLERFAAAGIQIVTVEEREYPRRLRDTLGEQAPPMLYMAGRPELYQQDAIAICGAGVAKGEAQSRVRALVDLAVDAGYVIVTDGATGISRLAEDEAVNAGGHVIEATADALSARVLEPDMARYLAQRRIGAITPIHPDAPYTISHALTRNKLIYALGVATFVFCAEARKGATWDGALQAKRHGYSNFCYAWDTDLYSGNRELIGRGFMPFDEITPDVFSRMRTQWRSAQAKQISLFDEERPLY